MWPLTLVPPKYKESYIVSFADKYLSSKEFIDEYKKRINRYQEKKARGARRPIGLNRTRRYQRTFVPLSQLPGNCRRKA